MFNRQHLKKRNCRAIVTTAIKEKFMLPNDIKTKEGKKNNVYKSQELGFKQSSKPLLSPGFFIHLIKFDKPFILICTDI